MGSEKILRFNYDSGMELLNALESFKKVLPEFGVKLELLDGGVGYEEIRLTKIENNDGK